MTANRSVRPLARITLAVLVLAGLLTIPGLAAGQTPSQQVGVLRLQQSPDDPDESFVFWKGGEVGDAIQHSVPVVGDQNISNCQNSPCFQYALGVESAGAARLRVAMDTPSRNDNFSLQVTGPDGQTVRGTNTNSFNRELFIDAPPVGTYSILVRPYSASNTRFQMRAKLEGEIPAPAPNVDGFLLPDLRPTAPYEFGFAAPANPLNGIFPPDDVNPPLGAAGIHPVSCAADETVDDQALRCLRFSFGLVNSGVGNFDVRWFGTGIGPNPNVPQKGPLFQCVQRVDGPPLKRPAGSFEYHDTHFHTHYKDLIFNQLYKVVDPQAGTLLPAGEGRKLGYSPADQAIADWHSFGQAPQGTSGSGGSCVEGSNARVGMSVGWGDVYRWQRPGNYTNFGANSDGLYVLRLVIDPANNVLELNESNNVAYTYIKVTGNGIEVLEYGRGLSPWDPNKTVLTPRIQGGVPW
jgi:hypothetical protein